jgi:hypothetical protein
MPRSPAGKTAPVRERQLVTRRMVKLEGERRKLLDAYYAGAIDLAVLRAEQQRIGGELRTAEQRLASVDATLEQWREVLETAMPFATDCGLPESQPQDPPAVQPCGVRAHRGL